jgi:hypothetical protein
VLGSEKSRLVNLIDYTHYLEAARRLATQNSPYKNLEYFSPPWFAIALIPLAYIPTNVSMLFWLILCLSSVFVAVNLWQDRWVYPKSALTKYVIAALFCIAPPSLYVYITGQASAIVLLCLTGLLLSLGSPWFTYLLMTIGITIKPHLVILPLFIHLLESIRKNSAKVVVHIGFSLLLLAVISTWFYPRWLTEWIQALMTGDYRGGPGLVSSGYLGYREIGIPIWLLVLPVFYTILIWYKEGQTPYMLCLSMVSNLLIIPYHRAYDYVFLYPASIYILSKSVGSTPVLVAKILFLFSVLILPLSSLRMLSPIFTLIALLILHISESAS